MDKNSNLYITGYAAILTIIVSIALALVSNVLKPIQVTNQALEKKTDILRAVGMDTVENIEEFFASRIESVVIKSDGSVVSDTSALGIDIKKESKKSEVKEMLLPLFSFKTTEGKINYIIPLYGDGLWDKIWGFIALDEDINTVVGASFDHKSETPGLGAEIKDSPSFRESFIGKKIFNENGDFVGVKVKKGSIKQPDHQVQAISGATITSDGVSRMVKTDIEAYLNYLRK